MPLARYFCRWQNRYIFLSENSICCLTATQIRYKFPSPAGISIPEGEYRFSKENIENPKGIYIDGGIAALFYHHILFAQLVFQFADQPAVQSAAGATAGSGIGKVEYCAAVSGEHIQNRPDLSE